MTSTQPWKNGRMANHVIQLQNNLQNCPMQYLVRQKMNNTQTGKLIYNPNVKCLLEFNYLW